MAIRIVVSLADIMPYLEGLKERYKRFDFMVWKRGRKLIIRHERPAKSVDGEVIGDESAEMRLDLEPIGTSSSRQGYARWLVYIDEPRISFLAPPKTKTYKRPSNKKIRRRMTKWLNRALVGEDRSLVEDFLVRSGA